MSTTIGIILIFALIGTWAAIRIERASADMRQPVSVKIKRG